MNFQLDDTIAALASAPGPGLRGIIRLSGPDVCRVVGALLDPDDPDRWRMASRRSARHTGRLRLSVCRVPLPTAVYLWPHRRSYTGQPTAELHTVGSPPLLDAVLSELYEHGVRPARPGEFTLRAFLAGRLDLMQAEAVLGVIDAHDHRELETALSQLAGGISDRLADVRTDLLNLLADLEAGLDFVDEDIEFVGRDEMIQRLADAQSTLEHILQQADSRMQTTGRVRVVLAGLPNAGKSTLFNALVGRAPPEGWSAALVSAVRGTTRDYLIAQLDWNGTAVELIDTAGWESTAPAEAPVGNGLCAVPLPPERTAERGTWDVGRGTWDQTSNPSSRISQPASNPGRIAAQAETSSSRQREQADEIVWCTAADFDAATLEADAQRLAALREQNRSVITVQTKSDLISGRLRLSANGRRRDEGRGTKDEGRASGSSLITHHPSLNTLSVSARTGAGLAELVEAVTARLSASQPGGRQWLGMTAARCRASLSIAAAALQSARDAAQSGAGDEILAIEVRAALDELGSITGAIYTDDLLDRIFSKFCIGK